MQIKIFTVSLFGNEEAVEEMNKFLRGNKVVDITKSLVQQGDVAYWSFCVTYLLGVPPKVQQPQAERKEKLDYRQVLDEPAFAHFAALRAIRKRLAEADAVPAFAVFTDATNHREICQVLQHTTAVLRHRLRHAGELPETLLQGRAAPKANF